MIASRNTHKGTTTLVLFLATLILITGCGKSDEETAESSSDTGTSQNFSDTDGSSSSSNSSSKIINCKDVKISGQFETTNLETDLKATATFSEIKNTDGVYVLSADGEEGLTAVDGETAPIVALTMQQSVKTGKNTCHLSFYEPTTKELTNVIITGTDKKGNFGLEAVKGKTTPKFSFKKEKSLKGSDGYTAKKLCKGITLEGTYTTEGFTEIADATKIEIKKVGEFSNLYSVENESDLGLYDLENEPLLLASLTAKKNSSKKNKCAVRWFNPISGKEVTHIISKKGKEGTLTLEGEKVLQSSN